MDYANYAKKVISNYGQPVKCNSGAAYKAFVQSLRYKNKLFLAGNITKLGYDSQTHYLYIGPANMPVNSGDFIDVDGVGYTIVRSDKICVADKPVYYWAILKRNYTA